MKRYFRCVESAAFGERVEAVGCGWASEMAGMIMEVKTRGFNEGSRLRATCAAAVGAVVGIVGGCGDFDVGEVCRDAGIDVIGARGSLPRMRAGVL